MYISRWVCDRASGRSVFPTALPSHRAGAHFAQRSLYRVRAIETGLLGLLGLL